MKEDRRKKGRQIRAVNDDSGAIKKSKQVKFWLYELSIFCFVYSHIDSKTIDNSVICKWWTVLFQCIGYITVSSSPHVLMMMHTIEFVVVVALLLHRPDLGALRKNLTK